MPCSIMNNRRFLFLVAATREPGHTGNTEWLARQARLREHLEELE